MSESLEEKKQRVYRERWFSNEGQRILKGAIEVLRNKQSLEQYFLSLPYFDYEWADPWNLEGTPMNELELSNSSFQDLLLIDVQFRSSNLKNSSFKGAKIFDIDFSNADLSNVNFEKCHVSKCNFVGANLSGANFSGAIFMAGNLDDANLSKTNFTKAKLYKVSFQENAFSDAIMEETVIRGSEFARKNKDKNNTESDKNYSESGLSTRAVDAIEELDSVLSFLDPPERWEKY